MAALVMTLSGCGSSGGDKTTDGGPGGGGDGAQTDGTVTDAGNGGRIDADLPGRDAGMGSMDVGIPMDSAVIPPDMAGGATADMGGGPTPASLRDLSNFQAQAPATFRARFTTSAGVFTIEARRESAPIGVDRFYNLVRNGYFDGIRFFRVVPDFIVQFGIHGDPTVSAVWRRQQMSDDPVVQGNGRGFITYATAGPNTRTTQMFINFKANNFLDGQGFAAFGQVVEGMDAVDGINAQYGESPDQGRIQSEGNAYLEQRFPELDYIIRARVVE